LAVAFASKYGPWAIVAGASEGLGAAFAHVLAAYGCNLVLLARREELLRSVATRIRGQYQIEVRTAGCDLARPDLASALETFVAGVDIGLAVYNAAYVPVGEFALRPLDDLLHAVDVNVKGPLIFARTLAPKLIARGRGGIVLMSSLAGFQGAPNISTYVATKAFSIVLGEGLWSEMRRHGVDVAVSCAGAIRTPGYGATAKGDAPGILDADVVAEQTLSALGHGPLVMPGAVNRLARFVMGRLLPRRIAIAVMARSTRELS
jgi:short-subunit dehydrogenase